MAMATHCKHCLHQQARFILSLETLSSVLSGRIWGARYLCCFCGNDWATTYGIRAIHLAMHTTCSSTCDWTKMKCQCIWRTLRISCIGDLIGYNDWTQSVPDMTWSVFLNPCQNLKFVLTSPGCPRSLVTTFKVITHSWMPMERHMELSKVLE